MRLADTLLLATRTLRSNRLRTGITMAIIAFGIMALIGIITATSAMNQKLTESFSAMGANGFTIRYKERNFRIGTESVVARRKKQGGRKENAASLDRWISRNEAEQFIRRYELPAVKGLSVWAGNEFEISNRKEKTNPSQYVFGVDANYLELNGMELLGGRNISEQEVGSAAPVCLLGYDVAKKLYPSDPVLALQQLVRVNGIPFRVVGVLAGRGSVFGFSRDGLVLLGYKTAQQYFATRSFTIAVMMKDMAQVEYAMGEAEGMFRAIRQLPVSNDNNFVLERSDSVAEKAIAVLRYLTIAVIVIGFITLTGSAIGLMNIMLVSVSERTREVGLIKALGGERRAIRMQFLTEALLISGMGALAGIVLGIGVGNLFSALLHTGFVVPWKWIIYGLLLSTVVGVGAGLYPAWKAGNLNPISALRYE